MIDIETGYEIPERKYPIRYGAPLKYPWPQMHVGDSFFIPSTYSPKTEHLLKTAAYSWSKRNDPKRRYETRQVDGGVRIWRVA